MELALKKGQVAEGTVERFDFPNKGIVNIEESRVTVKNVLPGQKIRFSVNKVRKGKCEGRLLEVLEPSPMEDREASCRHFGACGGCCYQTMSYGRQLSLKAGQVKQLLDTVCDDFSFEGIKGSPTEWEYRNKMEFSFGDEFKDGPLALGMHKKGSFHDIINVTGCCIVHNDYNLILECVRTYFTKLGTRFYHKMSHEGYLRHLLVRRAAKTGEMLVSLVTTSQEEVLLQPLADQLLQLDLSGTLVSILHVVNDSLADVVKSDRTEVLYGKEYFYEKILGLKFKISTFSFFQTNSLGAEVLYSTVREYVGETKDKLIFDLYSGTGTIAQILAPVAEKVIGVEIVEEAVMAARENACLNGLDNCEFIVGDVLKVIDEIEEKPDLIVLDPPRDGIHPKALQKIIDFGVEKMVYISCKPTSLVRDLEVLQARGYRVLRACAVDMFAQGANVETVVLLSQQKPKDRIAVDLDLDEMDATSAETKATYAEIKDYALKEHGLKVSSLYISQVKRKCGIEVGENYNLREAMRRKDCLQDNSMTVANPEDVKQPQCTEEKEKTSLFRK